MNRHIFLYKIVNEQTGKIYIGQTVNPSRRWKDHRWLSKNKPEQYIHHAIAKHGLENFIFEVIATCVTQDNANEIEKELIVQYDSRSPENGYNISPGGDPAWNRGLPKEQQPMYGKKQSEFQKQRVIESHLGKPNPHSKEWSEKMSVIMKNRVIDKSWRQKISEAQTKFSIEEEKAIVIEYESGVSAKILSNKYGCSIPTIFNIIKRRKLYSS